MLARFYIHCHFYLLISLVMGDIYIESSIAFDCFMTVASKVRIGEVVLGLGNKSEPRNRIREL